MELPPLIAKPWQRTIYPAQMPVVDTNAASTSKAKRKSRARLKKKNRKGKKHRLTLALDLTLEAGDVYTLQGFSPDFDGPWLITEVEHKFAGKSGSQTTLTLQKCITGY
jgi:phage protein D